MLLPYMGEVSEKVRFPEPITILSDGPVLLPQ